MLLVSTAADWSAVGGTARSSVIAIVTRRRASGARAGGSHWFHGTNGGVHGTFDEATENSVAAGAVLNKKVK